MIRASGECPQFSRRRFPKAPIGRPAHVRAEDPVDEKLGFGDRLADLVASFGGSWTFILWFLAVLVAWVLLNSLLLVRWHEEFDPYPYILLNLFLSMLAALQAPVIMMSQNRQAKKDRVQARHDYEINLRAELEIAGLHHKLDAMRISELHQALRRLERRIASNDPRHSGSVSGD
jgi:uncharacterized membrane protein